MAEREFDAIVIGAGPAGEVAAGRMADGGLDVALVEPELVGGECSFWACMPSKALLRPAALLAEVGRVPGLPVEEGGSLDAARVIERRNEVVHDYDDSAQLPWLEDRGIALVRTRGALDGERRVRAGDDVLLARRAVLVATGSGPVMPPIDGLDEVAAWSNREITSAKSVPASLVVLGGGVVGVEMAQAWASLGSEVTIVEAADRLIAREEEFASEQVTEALREHGVDVRLGAKAERFSGGDGEPVKVELGGGAVEGEHVLVAVGRRPRVEGIGLESVGIEPDGPLEVDDRMRAGGREWLYAIGDVNGRALLTHVGKYQARAAADNVLGMDVAAPLEGAVSPRVIFTDPEVAAVGHTLASAREAGIEARAVDVSTAGNAGASFHGRDATGTSRLVVDEGRGVVCGATFTGPDANELLHAATIAITAEVPLERLWQAVPAFPTRNEIWLNLLEKYGL
jgi:pyruvate/2-oxoglutarate dehydrogenase complex dihydrolipoamide dehydrogenase (E3) component